MSNSFDKSCRFLCTEDEFLEELKSSAFEALLQNPGSEYNDWQQILIENYATKIENVYGSNPSEVFAGLADLWETPYEDTASGLEYTFCIWAAAFATDASVQMYYDMIDRKEEVKHTSTIQ